jgi:hypothetical protein
MATESNSTVLGVASMSKTLPVVCVVLIVLFVFIKPEATAGYGFLERLLFWTVHIGLGLASVVLASRLLRPALGRAMPLVLAILVTGIAGAALLAPVYLLLEQIAPAGLVEEPDSWLDVFAAQGVLQSVIAEFLEVTPVFLAAWFAVNLPLLLARPVFAAAPPDTPAGPGGGHATSRQPDERQRADDHPGEQFFALIPRALGRDIIAVSSDMHYLHVHTTLGKCMVLGTIRDAASLLGDAGLQVHRSHWVAHAHVRRIRKRGSAWECVMTNDLRIPVSRRNRARVAEWYGSAGNIVSIASRKVG